VIDTSILLFIRPILLAINSPNCDIFTNCSNFLGLLNTKKDRERGNTQEYQGCDIKAPKYVVTVKIIARSHLSNGNYLELRKVATFGPKLL